MYMYSFQTFWRYSYTMYFVRNLEREIEWIGFVYFFPTTQNACKIKQHSASIKVLKPITKPYLIRITQNLWHHISEESSTCAQISLSLDQMDRETPNRHLQLEMIFINAGARNRETGACAAFASVWPGPVRHPSILTCWYIRVGIVIEYNISQL